MRINILLYMIPTFYNKRKKNELENDIREKNTLYRYIILYFDIK